MKRGSSTVFAPLDPVKNQPWELFVFDFVSIYACLFACFLAKMTISGPFDVTGNVRENILRYFFLLGNESWNLKIKYHKNGKSYETISSLYFPNKNFMNSMKFVYTYFKIYFSHAVFRSRANEENINILQIP